MDLWIRSQDKELLLKVDFIRIRKVIGMDSVYYNLECKQVNSLAQFSTKERALEVLDEIQSRMFGKSQILVYQMPQE